MSDAGGLLDSRLIANAEVRANGGSVVYRGPARADDPRWPAEAAALHRGLKITDLDDPDRGWVVLVFPDGSVRINGRIAREHWFTGNAPALDDEDGPAA